MTYKDNYADALAVVLKVLRARIEQINRLVASLEELEQFYKGKSDATKTDL